MTLLLAPTDCLCGRPFADAADPRFLPTGIATLGRLQARCGCGEELVLCYEHLPVANDEERAESVRILREIRRRLHEGNPDREVCEIALSRMEG